jgi:hypothetical protein
VAAAAAAATTSTMAAVAAAAAAASAATATTTTTFAHNATTPMRRHHSSSVPSTPRRMANVSQAPPSAPSTQRATMLANNKAYMTRLTVTAGSSLAERFGVDLSPMSPKASPRKQPGSRGRELHVRTPTAGGSLVIGGSLGPDVMLVRPRNLATSFHAPANLFK